MHIPHTVHSHIKPDPKITTQKKKKSLCHKLWHALIETCNTEHAALL